MIDDKLSQLLDDPDFWVIQRRRSQFNIFEALGAVNGELKHSNFLGYLMAPSRPHGLGTRALQLLLRRCLEHVPSDARPISTLELMVGDLDDAIVYRERDGIDLLIEVPALNLVVLIENKIHAKAGDGQLEQYKRTIEAKYASHRRWLIFLTPDGLPPDDSDYHAVSYSTLAAALEELTQSLSQDDAVRLIIQHYVDMLRRWIVSDDALKDLAAKLYERHAEAFDFIFANRPKPASLISAVTARVQALEDMVIDTIGPNVLRFGTTAWDQRLSFKSPLDQWTKSGRGVLFEVKTYTGTPGRLNISLIIGPGDQKYRTALHEAARARPELFRGLVKSIGKSWVTIFSQDFQTMAQARGVAEEAQLNNVGLAWSDFQAQTLPALIDAIVEIDAQISGNAA